MCLQPAATTFARGTVRDLSHSFWNNNKMNIQNTWIKMLTIGLQDAIASCLCIASPHLPCTWVNLLLLQPGLLLSKLTWHLTCRTSQGISSISLFDIPNTFVTCSSCPPTCLFGFKYKDDWSWAALTHLHNPDSCSNLPFHDATWLPQASTGLGFNPAWPIHHSKVPW
jgi:hypothetical protein